MENAVVHTYYCFQFFIKRPYVSFFISNGSAPEIMVGQGSASIVGVNLSNVK